MTAIHRNLHLSPEANVDFHPRNGASERGKRGDFNERKDKELLKFL